MTLPIERGANLNFWDFKGTQIWILRVLICATLNYWEFQGDTFWILTLFRRANLYFETFQVRIFEFWGFQGSHRLLFEGRLVFHGFTFRPCFYSREACNSEFTVFEFSSFFIPDYNDVEGKDYSNTKFDMDVIFS